MGLQIVTLRFSSFRSLSLIGWREIIAHPLLCTFRIKCGHGTLPFESAEVVMLGIRQKDMFMDFLVVTGSNVGRACPLLREANVSRRARPCRSQYSRGQRLTKGLELPFLSAEWFSQAWTRLGVTPGSRSPILKSQATSHSKVMELKGM